MLALVLVPRGEITRLDNSVTSFDYQKSNVQPSETPSLAPGSTRPRNIILFVADGMGFAHLALARALHDETNGQFAWDRFTPAVTERDTTVKNSEPAGTATDVSTLDAEIPTKSIAVAPTPYKQQRGTARSRNLEKINYPVELK